MPIAIGLISIAPTLANAQLCRTNDDVGQYILYGYSSGRVTRCYVTITGDQVVMPGTQCRQVSDGDKVARGTVTGGHTRLTTECRLTGQIDIQSPKGADWSIKILEGNRNPSGHVTGMGLDSDELAVFFVMQFIDDYRPAGR
jgi:hypothetical protein